MHQLLLGVRGVVAQTRSLHLVQPSQQLPQSAVGAAIAAALGERVGVVGDEIRRGVAVAGGGLPAGGAQPAHRLLALALDAQDGHVLLQEDLAEILQLESLHEQAPHGYVRAHLRGLLPDVLGGHYHVRPRLLVVRHHPRLVLLAGSRHQRLLRELDVLHAAQGVAALGPARHVDHARQRALQRPVAASPPAPAPEPKPTVVLVVVLLLVVFFLILPPMHQTQLVHHGCRVRVRAPVVPPSPKPGLRFHAALRRKIAASAAHEAVAVTVPPALSWIDDVARAPAPRRVAVRVLRPAQLTHGLALQDALAGCAAGPRRRPASGRVHGRRVVRQML
mmetsp:Transcript_50392/g.96255  ORF Transcript_50392/g.96255 Transcript_50392/m.96255 type:complete len:334 (-) Transcript_50392:142-1143(-)